MSLEALLGKLTREEKLAAMELLWEDLTVDSPSFVSPRWHETVLAERLAKPEPGRPLGLAAAQAEVKESLDEGRTSS